MPRTSIPSRMNFLRASASSSLTALLISNNSDWKKKKSTEMKNLK